MTIDANQNLLAVAVVHHFHLPLANRAGLDGRSDFLTALIVGPVGQFIYLA